MSSHRTVIPEVLKTDGRILFHAETTATGDEVGFLPAKSDVVYIVAVVTMGNAADLTLTVKTADDAAGTNTTALTENIAIYADDVRQTDAKAYAVTASTGDFTVVFCVPTILVPKDKYLGISYANSDAANILTVQCFEDTYHNG